MFKALGVCALVVCALLLLVAVWDPEGTVQREAPRASHQERAKNDYTYDMCTFHQLIRRATYGHPVVVRRYNFDWCLEWYGGLDTHENERMNSKQERDGEERIAARRAAGLRGHGPDGRRADVLAARRLLEKMRSVPHRSEAEVARAAELLEELEKRCEVDARCAWQST